jgi:hypothetical protein
MAHHAPHGLGAILEKRHTKPAHKALVRSSVGCTDLLSVPGFRHWGVETPPLAAAFPFRLRTAQCEYLVRLRTTSRHHAIAAKPHHRSLEQRLSREFPNDWSLFEAETHRAPAKKNAMAPSMLKESELDSRSP